MNANAVRATQNWSAALSSMQAALDSAGDEPHEKADTYGAVYAGRRAAMVFDVVQSRQRRYATTVRRRVSAFEKTPQSRSLHALAQLGPGEHWGWRRGEAQAVQKIAAAFVREADEFGLDDDEVCRRWAEKNDLGLAFGLSPIAQIKGIKLALFTYLRMRCGADDLKPDVRLCDGLRAHGFVVARPVEAYAVGCQAAADLHVPRLVVDQLLW